MVNNQGFIVLVDISGYTKFIKMHKMRKIPFFGKKFGNNTLAHAETVISDLLEKIIENLDDTLIVTNFREMLRYFILFQRTQRNIQRG